jgi:hypothetical protein
MIDDNCCELPKADEFIGSKISLDIGKLVPLFGKTNSHPYKH